MHKFRVIAVRSCVSGGGCDWLDSVTWALDLVTWADCDLLIGWGVSRGEYRRLLLWGI